MATEQQVAFMVNLHQEDTWIDTIIWVDQSGQIRNRL